METKLRNLKLGVIGALVQIPLSVWEAGYNKDEELKADREGMRVAVLGGDSPYGAVTLFERFAKLHNEYIIGTLGTRDSELGRVFPLAPTCETLNNRPNENRLLLPDGFCPFTQDLQIT